MLRFSLLLILCALSPAMQAEPRLATLEYPPYSSTSLPGGGSIVELTKQAFATQGYEPQIDFLPWARVLVEMRNHNYQGALPLWPHEIIDQSLIASRPLLYSQLGLFTRKRDPVTFHSLADLRGYRVGTVRGYGYPRSILNSGIVVEEAVDDISNLRKLAAKRFDLVLLEHLVGEHLIAGDRQLQGKLIWQEPALERMPLMVGFAPALAGQPDWAAIYERGLRELLNSGEYTRILKRYAPPH